jgi:hypothetical protein
MLGYLQWKGCRLAAPFGIIELSHASESAQDNLLDKREDSGGKINIEVTSLDSVRQTVEAWLKVNPSDLPTIASEVVETTVSVRSSPLA